MRIMIKHDSGLEIELTHENTVLNVFGNPELNHVEVKVDRERRAGFYNMPEMLDELHRAGFPTYTRSDSPEWAVERWINAHPELATVEEHLP